MADVFDIQARAEHIKNHGRLVEVEAMSYDRGVFDANESDGLIEGNMEPGSAAKGHRSVLVCGDIIGTFSNVCRLTFDSDVVVLGKVVYAQISAKNIWVGGTVNNSQMIACQRIGIGGVAKDSFLTVGDVSGFKLRADQEFEKIKKHRALLDYEERKLNLEERHLDRLIKSTQFNLEFTAGGLLRRARNRLTVNLTRFYEALPDRSPERIDKALIEFYGKAVVGLLAKNNRNLIQNNVNRRKVFMGLIRALFELFMLTRKVDRMKEDLKEWQNNQKHLSTEMCTDEKQIWIKEGLLPNMVCTFVVPDVELFAEGELSIVSETANIQIVPAEKPLMVNVKKIHIDGNTEQLCCETETFQKTVFRFEQGQVVWVSCGKLEEQLS